MRDDGYNHSSARYRAIVFDGPEAMAADRQQVSAAMDATFGVKHYTTNESWIVGGLFDNGEVNTEGPSTSPAWRQRIEKARREIEEHKAECRVKVLAESFSRDDVLQFIGEIRRWANSLKERQ